MGKTYYVVWKTERMKKKQNEKKNTTTINSRIGRTNPCVKQTTKKKNHQKIVQRVSAEV